MIEKEPKASNIPSLADNHYYLFNDDFTPKSTGDLITFIIERNLMPKSPNMIKLLINSPGGELPSAFALIDTMKGSRVPIYTYGLGEISSCGLLTFIAGERGKRFITRNTSILSHQFFWGTIGKEHELFAAVKEFDNMKQKIVNHYKKCTGLPETDIKKYLLPPEDVWLTAKEAVKYGIADEIIDFY